MKKLLGLLAIGLLFFSCSKEEDPIPPTVRMTLPLQNDQFNAIDTIHVQGQIDDDQGIERVTVSLRSASNGSIIGSVWTVSPNSKSYALDMLLYLDDIHLPAGSYFLTIKATDEVNSTKEYIDIYINGAPRERLGVFIADNSGGTNNIHLLDNSFNATFYNTYPGNFKGMSIDAFNQDLLLAPFSSGDLRSVDLISGTSNWNATPTFDITSFYFSGDYTYIGLEDGSIKRYDPNGLSNFHGNSNLNFHVEHIVEHENYLVMEEQMLSGSTVILALRYVPSGVTAQQLTVNEDIIGIYGLSSNELVLLTNTSSNIGNLLFYDISIGTTSNPFAIGTGKIEACTEITKGLYLVAESNQLTLIDANGFSTSTYLSATNADQLYYDESTNELIVIDGNALTVYDYTSKSIIGSYTHTSPIQGLTFWYNKN